MNRSKWILIAAAVIAAGFLPILPAEKTGPTDYQRELNQIESDLAALPSKVAEPERTLRRTGLVYRRASLTADFAGFRAAERAIETAFATVGPTPDLLLLRANFNFKLHRISAAEDDLQLLDEQMPGVTSLRADIAFQRGQYDGARKGYSRAIDRQGKWDDIARMAYLQSRTGDYAAAEKSYAVAQEQISAKEMRSYAWVELQRGILDLERKHPQQALAHYRRAERAYSGYWLIDEHIAEALDLTGHTKEAVALYQKIIRDTHNPEYVNALARIVERTNRAAAAAMYAEADRLNAARFALYPEAAIGHVIRDALNREHPRADLLQLAMHNYELRPNGESRLLLARAYLRANDRATAKRLLDQIAATPWRTHELEDLQKN